MHKDNSGAFGLASLQAEYRPLNAGGRGQPWRRSKSTIKSVNVFTPASGIAL